MNHKLDTKPVPEKVMYINEPELADASINYFGLRQSESEFLSDNVRVYVPLDLNADAILRRLRFLICRYEEANEENEADFSADVQRIVEQIEIYDQVLYTRESQPGEKGNDIKNKIHSTKAAELVKRFVAELEKIPDGCAELFPFELIDELKEEYLT